MTDPIIDIINQAVKENKNLDIELNDARHIIGKPSGRLVKQGDDFNADGFTVSNDHEVVVITWDMVKTVKLI